MAQPGGDHDLAIRCYNRIEQLSGPGCYNLAGRQQAPGMLVTARPVSPAPARRDRRPAAERREGNLITSGPGWLQSVQRRPDRRPAGPRARG